MKLLLDTHIFLWYITNNPKLPKAWAELIQNTGNAVYLSVVSNWEIAIKFQLGKLPLPDEPATYIPEKRDQHEISSLTLDESSVGRLPSLPLHHRDPFDRMLICQALVYEMVLLTVDQQIFQYQVPTVEQ